MDRVIGKYRYLLFNECNSARKPAKFIFQVIPKEKIRPLFNNLARFQSVVLRSLQKSRPFEISIYIHKQTVSKRDKMYYNTNTNKQKLHSVQSVKVTKASSSNNYKKVTASIRLLFFSELLNSYSINLLIIFQYIHPLVELVQWLKRNYKSASVCVD